MPEADRTPAIRPLKFWTDWENDPENPGQKRPVDYVEWHKVGTSIPATNVEKVPRLMPNREKGRPAALEWPALEPYYEAWKKAEEPPEIGTPLAAWPGASPALVEALKNFKIKTVEDFAGMEDAEVSKIRLPNARQFWAQAKAFLQAQGDASKVEAALASRDSEIEELKRQIAEMKEAPKRGPGRPKKADTEGAPT